MHRYYKCQWHFFAFHHLLFILQWRGKKQQNPTPTKPPSVFPTHRLYLGGPPRLTAAQIYLVTHFCFYYYYYLTLFLFFFLSARDNETIRDRLTSWKSPLARLVLHCSFCVLKNCRHSHRQALFFYLYVAGSNNIHRPLPSAPASHTQEREFSTIFSNFQTRCLQYCPASARSDSPGAVSPLSASILCSERQRNSAFSWP